MAAGCQTSWRSGRNRASPCAGLRVVLLGQKFAERTFVGLRENRAGMSCAAGESTVVSLRQSCESLFQKVTEPEWLLYVATGVSRYLVQITPPVSRIPPVHVFISEKSNPGR